MSDSAIALSGSTIGLPVLPARTAAGRRAARLAPFALGENKAFHFAAGGMLAYRVLGATAVVSADPIGPPDSAGPIVESFERFARDRGWRVVLTAAADEHLAAYRHLGYRALQIGAEAVVDPRTFSLEGRRVRKVRQSVTRITRQGWTVETLDAWALDAPTVVDIDALESEWRAAQTRIQGFAMTLGRRYVAEADEDGLYVLARDDAGRLGAFLRFVRYERGLSLDVMRRTGTEPNGLNEAMVVDALRRAAAEGLEEVSLNFAGFQHVMTVDIDTLAFRRRLLRRLLDRTHGRFQLERLAKFNAKFFPVWRPRYLLYRGRLGLPRAGLRVLQAEGYVGAPSAGFPALGVAE